MENTCIKENEYIEKQLMQKKDKRNKKSKDSMEIGLSSNLLLKLDEENINSHIKLEFGALINWDLFHKVLSLFPRFRFWLIGLIQKITKSNNYN